MNDETAHEKLMRLARAVKEWSDDPYSGPDDLEPVLSEMRAYLAEHTTE